MNRPLNPAHDRVRLTPDERRALAALEQLFAEAEAEAETSVPATAAPEHGPASWIASRPTWLVWCLLSLLTAWLTAAAVLLL